MIAEYGLGLGSKKKKPSFFGKTQFLSDISRYKVEDHSEAILEDGLQTGHTGLFPVWRQHRGDVLRQLQTIFLLEVRDAFVVVTKCQGDIYPYRLSNSQV